jgi:two-component sensor histidine kinase
MPKTEHIYAAENEILRRHRMVITNLARLAALPAISRDEFFSDLVLRVADAIEIDHVKLLRYRPETSDLLLEAGVGWNEGIVGSVTFPADMSSPPGRAFRTGEPVVVEDMNKAEGFRFSQTLKDHAIVSLINVPVFVDGAAWGVLEADSSLIRGFTADTEEFMIAAAAVAGLVVARTNADEAHRVATAAAALEGQKRTLLLTEMQHRVKNNFQTMMAMIQLRRSRIPTELGRSLADECVDGIMAMSLAHEQLSPTRSGEVVELSAYLRALVSSISKPHEGIAIEVAADEIEVGIDEAVPLGLIVNEAITNAVKYAFPEGKGRIQVLLSTARQGEAVLCVIDDGVDGTEAREGGLGLKLMTGLARQLRGQIEHEAAPQSGTAVRVRFPRRPARSVMTGLKDG